MADIKITYETLFDLLRRERNREELQQLDATFYTDVLAYLAEKKTLLDSQPPQDSYHVTAESEKARIQFQNIKRILKELYDRREKKIVTLALNKVRTESGAADTQAFLPEERLLFHELTSLCSKYRREVLERVLRQSAPFGGEAPAPSYEDEMPSKSPPAPTKTPAPEEEQKPLESGRVRFLKAVPRFAGSDGDVFGPFTPGQEASLPPSIAEVLVRKGRAEQA